MSTKRPKRRPVEDTRKILEDPFHDLWNRVGKEFYIPTTLLREVPISRLVEFDSLDFTSDYRLDFYWPEQKLAIEINGATARGQRGAHSSYSGLKRDYYKQLFLAQAGIRLIELNGEMSKDENLIRSLIAQIANNSKKVPSPLEYSSWGSKRKQENAKRITENALIAYIGKRRTELPSTRELYGLLRLSRKSVKMKYIVPKLLELGWKQITKDKKRLWVKA